MTAKQLIKQLEKIVEQHGNIDVAVNWEELANAQNRVGNIANVNEVVFDRVRVCDGDGFTIINKDGSERTIRTAIIQ